ncbi:hypothetical protein NDU88_005633 [Pleurodeles waltl]|uniref:Yippee domain-containing protein n=1 Tax=Pleurodeles waltl TaxID=8319 RepID=A0AAV7L1C8_PLEWA|nr:hypothetical protein NDU88_005633 [Pleurodeles waltl]
MRSSGHRDRQRGAQATGQAARSSGTQTDSEELGAQGQAARSSGHRDRQRGAQGTGTGSEELGAQGQAARSLGHRDRQYEELGAQGQAARSSGHRDKQCEELGAQRQTMVMLALLTDRSCGRYNVALYFVRVDMQWMLMNMIGFRSSMSGQYLGRTDDVSSAHGLLEDPELVRCISCDSLLGSPAGYGGDAKPHLNIVVCRPSERASILALV